MKKKKVTDKAHEFILGFDSEWVFKGDRENTILSYQWHAITPEGSLNGIIYPEESTGKNSRLSLDDFVGRVLFACKAAKLFNHYPKSLTMVAHFSLADLSTFKDFHDTLKVAFSNVRKTYVSLKDPLELKFTDINNHRRSVSVTLRDSMLLAPAGTKLEDLGHLYKL
jgi:hypothetical protein